MRVGLLGCGSIGSAVAQAIADGRVPGTRLVGIADPVETEAARRAAALLECPLFSSLRPLLALRPDLVVEAASQEAVRGSAVAVLEAGVDLMIVSVGALADAELLARLEAAARLHARRLHVPSGAIGGIDIIKGAAVAGLDECRLTTTKPPAALADSPYFSRMGIDLGAIGAATVVYEGPASEAVQLFPQNVNVAATISLAGLGLEQTRVRLVADPSARRNIHEVYVRGAFGEATVRLENLPSPANPKSSYLTSLSVIATLQRLSRELQLGT